jgi:hypothetical protein
MRVTSVVCDMLAEDIRMHLLAGSRTSAAVDLLFVERSAPSAWADANRAGKDPGEVTLISKAASHGHIDQRQSAVAQLLFGDLDAARE